MLKSKRMTYLLLALSIVIWGVAGWKVYQAFRSPAETPLVKKEVKIIEKDTVSLLLNYKDPFLGYYQETTPATESPSVQDQSAISSIPNKTLDPIIAPNIQFKGLMRVGNTLLAILQSESKLVTLKAGEEVDGYKLTKVDHNKVVLSKNKKKYELSLQ